MHDARIDALARQLVRYSTCVKKGEQGGALIDLHDVPESIGLADPRGAGQGRIPLRFAVCIRVRLTARDAQGRREMRAIPLIAKHLLAEMKDMDAYIAIRGGHNIAETSDVPAEK
jgi:aminopeptidase